MKSILSVIFVFAVTILPLGSVWAQKVTPAHLRCEYLENPVGIDETVPRLSWRLTSPERGAEQAAYQILVASSVDMLSRNQGDLWDSGKVESDQSLFVTFQGLPLQSRQACFWKVGVWSAGDQSPTWSDPAQWTMALLDDSDWTAQYISYVDDAPVHQDVTSLYLPAARQYRKEFAAQKKVARATVYATAMGIYELHLNGKRIGDHYFAPGWTDYRQRAYYNTYDVTSMIAPGENALGAWVAEGWYSGYVGFGLLTGMGTEKNGRGNYGKTPSVMAQLEIQYTDGTTETIGTDASWKVTGDGPIQEADLLMGEAYDATREMAGWSKPGFDDSQWQAAILASENGSPVADFYEARNPDQPGRGPKISGRPRDLGFRRVKLEAFPGVPVRITEELSAKSVTEREPGTFVFDLGQNFAGIIRLKLGGPAGHKVTIRYGEMLHPDGRLMTENLRKARATDFYTLGGDGDETFQPRFTFHGFQYVEVQNFPGTPDLETVTGLVMHSDTPMTSTFECSDPMVSRLFQNVLWTQRSNFLDLPTDCPQRDERMGWTGDAQAYVGTAAYNADIGAFYTKWLRELMESQRDSGAFPGYAPFPFQHGWDFGSAWADAGVICPWTIWQAYGDTRVIDRCWEPMTRFMQWRIRTSENDLGISHGNAWGDWLAQGASTPLDYVDTIYLAISAKMMSEMATATGRDDQAQQYASQFQRTREAFQKRYLNEDGSVNVNTQTAQALALFAGVIPDDMRQATGKHLAGMIAENGNHMTTGFLGTRPLLPVLSASGQHDLATFLLQSREFPSWGYEIENGATTIWERWDSYTREDAFGRHNAAMNSFSHYAFGAVCEWMFETLAGISSDGPGYKKITIRPQPPSPGSNGMNAPIDWVNASYESIRGTIRSDWKIDGDQFLLNVTIPANTTATVHLPTDDVASIRESDRGLSGSSDARLLDHQDGVAMIQVGSGDYQFVASSGLQPAAEPIKTFKPADNTINPDKIQLAGRTAAAMWDFSDPEVVAAWGERKDIEVILAGDSIKLAAAGGDSQWATRTKDLPPGRYAIVLRANPGKGCESQFFWASPGRGFNSTATIKRRLGETDRTNDYVFVIESKLPIRKLRFDPFASYDQHANRPEMTAESIAVYALD